MFRLRRGRSDGQSRKAHTTKRLKTTTSGGSTCRNIHVKQPQRTQGRVHIMPERSCSMYMYISNNASLSSDQLSVVTKLSYVAIFLQSLHAKTSYLVNTQAYLGGCCSPSAGTTTFFSSSIFASEPSWCIDMRISQPPTNSLSM